MKMPELIHTATLDENNLKDYIEADIECTIEIYNIKMVDEKIYVEYIISR